MIYFYDKQLLSARGFDIHSQVRKKILKQNFPEKKNSKDGIAFIFVTTVTQ